MQNSYTSIIPIQNTLLQLVTDSRNGELSDFIEREVEQDISLIRDTKCNSLLHIAAYNLNYEAIRLLLYSQSLRSTNLVRWINSMNSEGLTALHISCFKGSIKISQYLVDHGADYYIKSSSGQMPIHTSAQGDSPALLIYFKSKGINLNIPDERGSTPLHWAAYAGAENSVNYLLALNCNMDIQDSTQGYTALHLAALQGYTRIVRKMLVRGVDRNIKSFKGLSALDIARENNYKNMERMLMDKLGIQEYLNIKQPYRPMSKNFKSVTVVAILYLIWNISILWSEYKYDMIRFFISQSALSVFTYILLILLIISNPGERKKTIDLLKALQEFEPQKICPDCQVIIKPPRSRHCEICQQCCIVYDHHCPWVNNCIGAINFKYFYLFLLTLFVNDILSFVACALSKFQEQLQISSVFTNYQQNHIQLGFLFISYVICLFIGALLFIPFICLVTVQTRNLFEGITTYERFANKGQQQISFITSNNTDLNQNNQTLQTALLDPPKPGSTNYSNVVEDQQTSKKPTCFENILDMCCKNSEKYNCTPDINSNKNLIHIQEDQISLN